MPRRSLVWNILLPFSLLLVLALVMLNLYFSSTVRQSLIDTWRKNLTTESQVIEEVVIPLLAQGEPYAALNLWVEEYAQRSGIRITIILRDGRVVAESAFNPEKLENHASRPEVQAALSGQTASEIRYSNTTKRDRLYVAAPIRVDGQIPAVLRLSVALEAVDQQIANLRGSVTLVLLLLMVSSTALAYLIARRTLKPLSLLADRVDDLSRGDFTPLPDTNRRDELGQLSRAINRMSAQIHGQLEAIRGEQTKASAILDNMTDAVLIIAADERVQYLNQAARRIFSFTETVKQPTLIEVVRLHQLIELWQKTRGSGLAQSQTLEVPAEKMFLQATATPLERILPGSTLMVLQDLTRTRRLETVRRDFISNVSHELRTPLASLKALSETLKEGALEDPPAARRFVERMETEIDTLIQLVGELLELSRIESGKLPLNLSSTDPLEILQAAGERMRLQAERARHTLIVPDAPAYLRISADPDRLEQVLINLIHNAIKFTPPGGEIRLELAEREQDVVFSVRDSGVGIPAEDLQRIFERFYKVDRARATSGTGLGLSISRHLVEAHGGQIWAESQPGQGSQFHFSIPKG